MNLIERIDDARRRWNVLDHPFYLRWERGELTRDELAFYAGEYRHAVVALADAAALGGDPEHAAEETAHVALWDDFAAALEAPLDREPTTETRECVTRLASRGLPRSASRSSTPSSRANPMYPKTKLTGLVEHYGFSEGSKSTEYFELHSERDHEHAAASAEVLRKAAPEDADRLVAAAEASTERQLATPRRRRRRSKIAANAGLAGLCRYGCPAEGDPFEIIMAAKPAGFRTGVRARGLEPLRSKAPPGPKPGASTNSATPASDAQGRPFIPGTRTIRQPERQ